MLNQLPAGAGFTENQFSVAMEHSPIGTAFVSLEGSWLWANAELRQLLGYSQAELSGMTFQDVTHPDDVASDERLVERVVAGELRSYSMEKRYIRKDGSVVPAQLTVALVRDDARGTPLYFISQVQDNTAKLAAGAERAQLMERVSLATRTAQVGIWDWDLSNNAITWDTVMFELYGEPPSTNVTLATFEGFVHSDDRDRVVEELSAAVAGALFDTHFRINRRDGQVRYIRALATVMRNGTGDQGRMIGTNWDVSDARRLQEEALAASKVKSEFLANMSHEIRTPLTAVLGYTSLLADRHDLDPKAQEQVERVAAAGRGLLAIVNDVLDFSKLEAGLTTITPSPTAARPLAREVLEMFVFQAGTKALTLRFEAATEIPEFVTLDPDRLRQILVNLVGNGVKFTDRGSVTVRLAYDPASERLGIEVADTGPGISARAQAKLFQRFSQIDGSSTRVKGGTGLGLAICMGLAEAMGGSITLRSRVGRGSIFRLELPATIVAAPTMRNASLDAHTQLEGLRVLVVDDNATNRELVRAILEPIGIEVSEACDGQAGIEVAANLPVDVILMDMRMPVLDGRDAAAAIRHGDGPNRDVPMLAFSAQDDGRLSRTNSGDLFVGRICKPLVPADLLSGLSQAMGTDDVSGEIAVAYAGH